jgi:hypothetical protein
VNGNSPWWMLSGQEMADSAKAVVGRLETDQSWRKHDALRRYSVYYGRNISSLTELERGFHQTGGDPFDDIGPEITYCKSAIDTSVARIAGPIRPKPVVLTEGADYATRLCAKRLSKFLDGQFQESQGCYPTIYDQGSDVFRDSAIVNGVSKVVPDFINEKVSVERLFIWDIYFDEMDARGGKPTQLYQRTTPDRHELIGRFPKHERRILEANACDDSDVRQSPFDSRRVVVWECYVLPTVPEVAGKHIVLLDDYILEENEYTHDTFPFAFQFWHRSPIGVSGNPPIDYAAKCQRIANKLLNYCVTNTQGLAGGIVNVEEGAYSDEQLVSNDALKIMKRKPGFQPPQVDMPPPFNPMVLDLAERHRQMVFEIFGVSELAAQSRREPGVTSGVALRNMTDLQDKRFLPQARQLEQYYTDVGKLMLRAVRDLDAKGIKPKSFLPSQGFIESIDWQTIDIGEESLYQVQVQSGSALTDTLGARLQFIADLQASGAIDPDTAARLMMSGNPDFEAVSNRKDAQFNWVERIIFEIHDTPDDEEPEVDSPDPLMNLPRAVNQMIDAYLECSSWPNTPEPKRRAMRTWVQQGIELIQRANPPQQPQAPAGAPGLSPSLPPPGAPAINQPPMGAAA